MDVFSMIIVGCAVILLLVVIMVIKSNVASHEQSVAEASEIKINSIQLIDEISEQVKSIKTQVMNEKNNLNVHCDDLIRVRDTLKVLNPQNTENPNNPINNLFFSQ